METILWIWLGINAAAVIFPPIAMYPMITLEELPGPLGFIFGVVLVNLFFLPCLALNAVFSLVKIFIFRK